MPTPKTVTKLKVKNGNVNVEFTSDVDKAQYFQHELCRAALRDVAKFVRTEFRTQFYQHFKRRTGNAGKAVRSTVYSSKKTTAPRVSIGLKNNTKNGEYAYQQEFGSKQYPKLGLLQNIVKDNISTIIEIEGQYLSELSGSEAQIKSKIDEEEYNEED